MLYRLFGLSVLVLLLAGCADEATKNVEQVSEPQKVYNWRMVTTWPKNFPGLGTGAENLANLITNLSNNRIF